MAASLLSASGRPAGTAHEPQHLAMDRPRPAAGAPTVRPPGADTGRARRAADRCPPRKRVDEGATPAAARLLLPSRDPRLGADATAQRKARGGARLRPRRTPSDRQRRAPDRAHLPGDAVPLGRYDAGGHRLLRTYLSRLPCPRPDLAARRCGPVAS